MSTEPLDTPDAVRGLEEAIRSDLAKASALFVEGCAVLEGLHEVLRFMPLSQSRLRGWINQAEVVAGFIAEEQADVSRKLLGNETPPIKQQTDHAHLEVVRAAKESEEAA